MSDQIDPQTMSALTAEGQNANGRLPSHPSTEGGIAVANRDPQPGDAYLTKLNTLLPAEITGLYLFLHSLANPDTNLYIPLFGFAIVISVVIYFIAPQLLNISDRLTRILYGITFLLWVCAIEVAALRLYITWKPFSFVVAGCTAIWTFALPYVFTAIKMRRTSG